MTFDTGPRAGTRIRQPRKRNDKTGNIRRKGCALTALAFVAGAVGAAVAIKTGVS